MTEPPLAPRLAAPNAEISEAAEKLILKTLAKTPAERHESMNDLRKELATCYVGEKLLPPASSYPDEVVPAPRKKRLTEEIEEWLSANRDEIVATRKRLEEAATEPRRETPAPLTQKKPH